MERVFPYAPDSYTRHRLSGMRAMEVRRRKFIAECEAVVVSDPPTAEEKERTRQMTTKARKWRILEQKPCERCGDRNSDAHHPDYGKPLLVRWLCPAHHGRLHGQQNAEARRLADIPKQEEAIKLAIKIAKSETRGRNYRDDVIGDALLAVAKGERTREGIEKACRRSIRREWAQAKRFISTDADEASGNAKYGELWDALRALPPKHYQAISLHFWGGLTQVEVAREMRVSQPFACRLIGEAKEKLRNLLSEVINMPVSMPLVGESE